MHDLHCHTHLSSCAKKESTLQVMIGALKKADIKVAGVLVLNRLPRLRHPAQARTDQSQSHYSFALRLHLRSMS